MILAAAAGALTAGGRPGRRELGRERDPSERGAPMEWGVALVSAGHG